METWLTEEELCTELHTNIHNIRQLSLDGKLRPFDKDLMTSFYVHDERMVRELPDGDCAHSFELATADHIAGCLYRRSDVNEYKKKHGVKAASVEKKQRKSDVRRIIIFNESKILRQDYPDMNGNEAMRKINTILAKYPDCKPVSRTTFNIVVKDLGFPKAKAGNPHNKIKK